MKPLLFSIFFLGVLVPVQSVTVQAETILHIVVEGNERLSDEAILQYVSSRVGENVSRSKIRDDLKNLYKTSLFKDIQIDAEREGEGVRLVIRVKEKEYIQEIRLEGMKAIEKDDLQKALNLKIPFLWDESLLTQTIESIRKVYRSKGFNLVHIQPTVLTENKKKVLLFQMDEGHKVVVNKIYLLGNQVFSDEVLKEVLITKEGGFWSDFSGSGRFDEEILAQVDARRLQLHYWKYGYAFVKVSAPSIMFTPDRKNVFVSFSLEEGEQYFVGNIRVEGDLDYIPDPEAFKKELASRHDDIWSYLNIQSDITKMQDLYGDHGYAYANVSPEWMINPENPKALDIVYHIDKGNLVYFGSIDIEGNLSTHDRVIRRELEFHEGELFHLTRFRDSKSNLEKLGYFSNVKFIQKDILEEKRMDVVIEVEEKQTGSLTLAASFSSSDRFGLQGMVSKVNLFGLGYDVNLSAFFSGRRQLFQLYFRNPRLYDSHLSISSRIFNTEFQSFDETRIQEQGGSLELEYPLTKQWNMGGTYRLEHVDINIQDVIRNLYPDSFGLNSSVGVSLTRDTLNRREMFLPSSGTLNTLSSSVASQFFGSDMSYWHLGFTSKKYIEVFSEEAVVFGGSVLSFGLRLDYIQGIENRSIPFNERFFPGGIYSIRGHPFRSLGPVIFVPFNLTGRRADDQELDVTRADELHLGGSKQMIFNMEYLFDIFKEAKIKGVLFFDVGNTFPEQELKFSDIRYSTGFGFRWFSPLGPLRFEWGIPLDRRKNEESVLFDFSIGAPF